MTSPAPRRFQFTRDHTKKPFDIAGRTFFGKPLTAAEEDVLQEINLLGYTRNPGETLQAELELLREVLERRRAGTEALDPGWVAEHLGRANTEALIRYLRTGVKAHGPLDLPVFSEPIQIDDQVFTPRAMSFAEQLTVTGALDALNATEVIAEAQALAEKPGVTMQEVQQGAQSMLDVTTRTNRLNADLLAELLNARAEQKGDPLTGDQLRETLPAPAITQLNTYLREGTLPEDDVAEDAEGESPNA
ncbi:hypothetical protein [uncultured Deinococcus sp.]|uniref:hypothetical protein n=1 Tax=uncultured Deinococcus sp. TaxID=158789 RepID=UPI0025F5670F|nr:hypothetical protein [uncultured Deinococcus sp.]